MLFWEMVSRWQGKTEEGINRRDAETQRLEGDKLSRAEVLSVLLRKLVGEFFSIFAGDVACVQVMADFMHQNMT